MVVAAAGVLSGTGIPFRVTGKAGYPSGGKSRGCDAETNGDSLSARGNVQIVLCRGVPVHPGGEYDVTMQHKV